MRTKALQERLLLGLIFLLALSHAHSQNIKTTILDEALFRSDEAIQRKRIAFIDLSARHSAPQILVVNIKGDILSRISIPELRFSPNWTQWGPGIAFDKKKQTIWYLAPKVGLTEFDLTVLSSAEN